MKLIKLCAKIIVDRLLDYDKLLPHDLLDILRAERMCRVREECGVRAFKLEKEKNILWLCAQLARKCRLIKKFKKYIESRGKVFPRRRLSLENRHPEMIDIFSHQMLYYYDYAS